MRTICIDERYYYFVSLWLSSSFGTTMNSILIAIINDWLLGNRILQASTGLSRVLVMEYESWSISHGVLTMIAARCHGRLELSRT